MASKEIKSAIVTILAGINTDEGVSAEVYNGTNALVGILLGSDAQHHLANLIGINDEGKFWIESPMDLVKWMNTHCKETL